MHVLDNSWLKMVGKGSRTRAQIREFLAVPIVYDVLELLLQQLYGQDPEVVWGAVDTIYHLIDGFDLCDYVYLDNKDGDADGEVPQAEEPGETGCSSDKDAVLCEFGEETVEVVAALVNGGEECSLDSRMLKVRQEMVEWMSSGEIKRKLVHRLINVAGYHPDAALCQYAADLCAKYCGEFFFYEEDVSHIEAHINSVLGRGDTQPGVVMALRDAAASCDSR